MINVLKVIASRTVSCLYIPPNPIYHVSTYHQIQYINVFRKLGWRVQAYSSINMYGAQTQSTMLSLMHYGDRGFIQQVGPQIQIQYINVFRKLELSLYIPPNPLYQRVLETQTKDSSTFVNKHVRCTNLVNHVIIDALCHYVNRGFIQHVGPHLFHQRFGYWKGKFQGILGDSGGAKGKIVLVNIYVSPLSTSNERIIV